MNNKVLYYPEINIPQDQWLYKSILYWDEVAAIIPRAYGEEQILTKFSRDLLKNNLLVPIRPFSNYDDRIDFVNFFISLLHNTKLLNLDEKREDFKNKKVCKIHFNKFHYSLYQSLIDLKLARYNWPSHWLIVERETGKLLMTYLANVLAKSKGYVISTDNRNILKTNLQKFIFDERILTIRESILKDILPFPLNVSVRKIAKFKEKYYDDLKSFRFSIEKLVLELALIEDKKKYKKYYKINIESIEHNRDVIVQRMNESKLGNILFSSMGGLVTASLAVYLTKIPELGIGPLWGGINSALNEYEKDLTGHHELSYLALVNKRLIKK